MYHRIGECPHCGGNVAEFSKFYGCRNWKNIDGACPFTLPKRFCGKDIPSNIASELLTHRESRVLKGFTSKKGNTFSASLILLFTEGRWKLRMQFT